MIDNQITITDKMIPYYVRFLWGFGYIGVFIGLVNFGMILITTITVKGFYIPLWVIPIVGAAVILFCTGVGYYFEKYDIQKRIASHSNRNANTEFAQQCAEVKEILEILKNK
jgi:hypothetical protein